MRRPTPRKLRTHRAEQQTSHSTRPMPTLPRQTTMRLGSNHIRRQRGSTRRNLDTRRHRRHAIPTRSGNQPAVRRSSGRGVTMELFNDHFQNEVWLPVPGTNGIYEASSLGRIRSVDRVETQRNGRQYHRRGRILAMHVTRNGYLQTSTRVNGKTFERMVHRLVLAAFTGEFPEGMQVCHNDGNPRIIASRILGGALTATMCMTASNMARTISFQRNNALKGIPLNCQI